MPADPHDRALEDWVLVKVAGLDRDALRLGIGVRELPVPGVAEAARMDERVVGVVLERLHARGLVRAVDAEPARVVLTPEGRRGAAALGPAPQQPPPVDPARFVFLRPQPPQVPTRDGDPDAVCDFHPSRRKGTSAPGEYCDGSGWLVDPVTRESRACRCRPLRIRRHRDRRLGGRITPEIRNLGLASSLEPELHPALHPIVAGWAADIDRHLDEGRGLWMTVGPWDRKAQEAKLSAQLDDAFRPPRTPEEFAEAAARAGRLLDADAVGAGLAGEERASRAGGELSLMEVRKLVLTAAGAAAYRIARAAAIANRGVALYSLSSLYRSLVYLSRFGGYRERLEALQQCDLLLIVNLDQHVLERAAPWQRGWLSEQLELIAYGRYEHCKATVVHSTGWPLADLEAALSPETFHRLSCAAGTPLLGSRIPQHA